jgi:hypothetical protein
MRTRISLSALVASPLLLTLAPSAADVSFRPVDDSKVTRTYSIDLEFELGDLSVVVDGQDVSEMVPADFEGTTELMMKVTDHFVRSAGGRPLELIRSYEEMNGEASAMGESQSMDGFDALEGKQVRFVWDEEDEDYTVSFHECEGDTSDLEGLTPDTDMLALLPGKEIAEGDTWTVDARELGSVILFGAKPESDDAEFDQMFESEIWPQLEALLEDFTTTCEFKGEREEDGRKVGVVAVTMHGEGTLDLAALILQAAQIDAGEMQVDIDVEAADLNLVVDAKGELLWDLAGGHLHAFDLDADMEFSAEVAVTADVGGESHSADADAELSGRGTWKVRPGGE